MPIKFYLLDTSTTSGGGGIIKSISPNFLDDLHLQISLKASAQ